MRVNSFLKKGILDSVFYLISLVLSRFVFYLIIPFIVKNDTTNEYINYELFLNYYIIVLIFFQLGLDSGLSVFIIKKDKAYIIKLFSFYILLQASLLFLYLILFQILNLKLNSIFWSKYGLFVLLYAFTSSFFSYVSAYYRWNERAKASSLLIFISSTTPFIVAYFYTKYFHCFNVYNFIRIVTFTSLLMYVLMIVYLNFYLLNFNKVFQDVKKKKLASFYYYVKISIPFFYVSLLYQLLKTFDKFIANNLLVTNEKANYFFASRIGFLIAIAIQLIGTGIYPILLKNYDKEDVKKLAKNIFNVYLVLMPIITLFTYIFKYEFVKLLGSNMLIESTKYMTLIVAINLITGLAMITGMGFMISKNTRKISELFFYLFLSNVILGYFGCVFFGIFGLLLVSYICNSVFIIFYLKKSEKYYSFNYNLKYLYFSLISMLLFCVLTYK